MNDGSLSFDIEYNTISLIQETNELMFSTEDSTIIFNPTGIQGIQGKPGDGIDNFTGDPLAIYILTKG